MRKCFTVLLLLCCGLVTDAQYSRDYIQTNVVLNERRQHSDLYLRQEVIGKTFRQPLDSNTEYKYEAACLAASQFMIDNDNVKATFDTLFLYYDSLQYSTKRALLEAVYGLFPKHYFPHISRLFEKETDPKLFAMQAVYLYQSDTSQQQVKRILKQLKIVFGTIDTLQVLQALPFYLMNIQKEKQMPAPPVSSLFAYQKTIGRQMIYSFQRWNRDYPGLSIIQNGDGSFARDSLGKLQVFQQLARSASNLPYFITGGNTPQGIYSVQGTGISHNNLIGPTPNLQLLLPFENNNLYWHPVPDSSLSFWQNYMLLLPADWRNYLPMQEALQAGSAGRTAIIAHGSTIDPEYFKNKPFYPLSPTLGCLCAKENWNIFTGKIVQSDQLDLTNAYLAREEDEAGYLMVINLDNRQSPVTREEIETLVKAFEKNKRN